MIYLKFGSVLGDVQEATHPNWIEVLSLSWGVTRPVSNPAGSTAGRMLSAPQLTELTLTKVEDVATIPLVQQALEGHPCEAKIDFVSVSTGQAVIWYSIAMKGAVISAFTQSSSGERPLESLTFNFTQISFEGTQMDADGSATSPSSYGWNVSGNAPA